MEEKRFLSMPHAELLKNVLCSKEECICKAQWYTFLGAENKFTNSEHTELV